ncbi:MAG: DNA mismatch repair endonuclease MutL [Pseudomonadota bacterium]|nr:DNA mismatch repair endonuclease MutL [Pseudomonadota bacterium]
MTIQLLSNAVINKIKAGEMIVRPANVIKELVENAIDAQATHINVAVQRGGLDAITVSDNGIGISADKLELAVQRHTTSKINTVEDLYNLQSLGFRGEALASMAEVSRFSIASVQAGHEQGMRLTAGQNLPRQMEWSGTAGTTVKVKELFFNIPVRRKFLKSPATEYMHCLDCMHAFVLGHPQIAFTFSHNGKEQLRAEICSTAAEEQRLRERSTVVFGVQELLYGQAENEVAKLSALFSPPGIDRGNARLIYTFVNDRWVSDKLLKYGILRGYHSHLLKGRYPLYVGNLRMHPSLLDVNVHPTKSEIKFQYAKEVQELLALTIRRQLRTGNWTLPPASPTLAAPPMPASSASSSPSSTRVPLPAVAPLARPLHQPLRSTFTPAPYPTAPPHPPHTQTTIIPPPAQQGSEEILWQQMRLLGVFAKCYLLFKNHEELMLVDQHAFHERIIYEQIMTDPALLAQRQTLAIVETITQLSPDEIELVAERRDAFAHYGFELVVDGAVVQVKTVPTLLQGKNIAVLVRELIALAQKDLTAWLGETLLHDVVATIACRAAVKAGDTLTDTHLQQLLTLANKVDFYHNCPHGRRVIRTFSKQQVGNWFDRI